LNKCKKCGRPLTKNDLFCSHCKTKIGNITGRIGKVIGPIIPAVFLIVKKFKK
jgi:uncharacterized membrane protein YvbJ